MEEYDEMYTFTITATNDTNGKAMIGNNKISVAKVYDKLGYQHRYVVKGFLQSTLDQLEKNIGKKDK